MLHIIHAHDHAKAGYIPEAEDHRNKAHAHLNQYVSALNEAGYPENAKKFASDIHPYLEKLDQIIDHAKSQNTKPQKKAKFFDFLRRSELENMTEEELEKALEMIPGTKPSKITTKVAADRQPGKDSRYNYKPFHELSHEDQIKATHAFQDKDMGGHHYPVDKETGSFVHGATRWLQPKSAARPTDTKGLVAPEHRNGAYVRINAEGSPFHGKTGIVKMPHPNFPGKVPVQVGLKDHQVEYFSPHQVSLNKSDQEDSSIEKLVSKSREVLSSIKKGSE